MNRLNFLKLKGSLRTRQDHDEVCGCTEHFNQSHRFWFKEMPEETIKRSPEEFEEMLRRREQELIAGLGSLGK